MQKQSFLPVILEKEVPENYNISFLTVTLGEGPVKKLHVHQYMEIGLCLQGTGVFLFSDKAVPVVEGDVSIFARGMPHHANSNPGKKCIWTFMFFDPSKFLSPAYDQPEILSPFIMNSGAFPCIFKKKDYPELSSLVKKICASYEAKEAWYEIEIKAILIQILINAHRIANHNVKVENEFKQDFSSIYRISPALQYISNNYHSSILIKKLARICGMSVETLRRQFKKAVGRTPEKYIQNIRIQEAASLLENSPLPIGEISSEVGFRTLSCFNRQFRKIMQSSPRQWRKKFM